MKLGPDAYCTWSGVSDAPSSSVFTFAQAKRMFGEVRVQRAYKWGSSMVDDNGAPIESTPEQNVAGNRAGPGESELTLEQIIEEGTVENPGALRYREFPMEGDGVTYVWVCDMCGQPLPGEQSVCNSGLHNGPGDVEPKGKAIKSTDMAERWQGAEDVLSRRTAMCDELEARVQKLAALARTAVDMAGEANADVRELIARYEEASA